MKLSFLRLGILLAFLRNVDCQTLTKDYTSYRRYPLCRPSDYMRYPTNCDDVIAIVKEAISLNKTVKAFGTRHSQTDIICTEGIPVDMTNLKAFEMNADNVRARFGAGVTLNEAGAFLKEHGRALRTTPAYGALTLGGVIGTGAHGSSIKYNSTVSDQVVEMTVVDGLGRKLIISESNDLKAFRTSLGLLGIVCDVTLYTVPLYKVHAHNYMESDEILTNGVALNRAISADQMTFIWLPSLNKVGVNELTFVPDTTPGNAYTNVPPITYGYFNVIVKGAREIGYDLTSSECSALSALGNTVARSLESITESFVVSQSPGLAPFYTEDGVTMENPATGYAHRMLATELRIKELGLLGLENHWSHGDIDANLTILDSEFAISTDDLKDFVLVVKDIARKTPTAFPFQGVVFRFSGASDTYMSTAYKRNTVNVEFYLLKRTNSYKDASGSLAAFQTIGQTLTKNFTGRSHWGKSGLVYQSREMLELKMDPSALRDFLDAIKKFDPNGMFQNSFGRRLQQKDNKIDIDPLTTRCALLDNCFCSNNTDCANTQSCTTLPGYPYHVCKTRNEVMGCSLDDGSFPQSSEVLTWLDKTLPTLVSATVGKCPLGTVPDTVIDFVKSTLDPVGSLLG